MLRDEIANILVVAHERGWPSMNDADAILALPSGLVAVRECNHDNGTFYQFECVDCKGKGHIVRELTLGEVVEFAKEWAKPDAIRELYYSQDGGNIFILYKGEKIMRKEDL